MELTQEQIKAIKRSINLGSTLQKDHPEIAELYVNTGLRQIVKILNIQSEYDVNEGIARSGVIYAIMGHNGGLRIDAYQGLISDEERARIRKEHKIGGGRRTYEEKKGIHAQSTEELREIGRKSGKIVGRKTYEEKKGIHAQTTEEKRECGRRSAIAKGHTLWDEEEKESAYQLSLRPEYKRGSQINLQLIAFELNKKYHNSEEIRNVEAVGFQIRKYKKTLESKVE